MAGFVFSVDVRQQYCRYHALIECPNGETYSQGYDEFEDLINLYNSLGDGFSIAEIY